VSPQVLGVVACRVTSTILGIGSAERSWGAVKHLKTNKRSHLGGETTRMQATVFGAACIEKSRVLKVDKEKRMELWNDNDVEFQIGLENWRQEDASPDDATERNPRRLFRAWKEDWELESAHKNDAVHEAKLLRKYAGLKWIDPDTELMFVAEGGNMEWRRGIGWCVIALDENGEMEPWPVNLLPSLIKKTEQEYNLNVEIVHLSSAEKEQRRLHRARVRQESASKGKRKRQVLSDDDSSSDDGENS
jgi:hypothetical protein